VTASAWPAGINPTPLLVELKLGRADAGVAHSFSLATGHALQRSIKDQYLVAVRLEFEACSRLPPRRSDY